MRCGRANVSLRELSNVLNVLSLARLEVPRSRLYNRKGATYRRFLDDFRQGNWVLSPPKSHMIDLCVLPYRSSLKRSTLKFQGTVRCLKIKKMSVANPVAVVATRYRMGGRKSSWSFIKLLISFTHCDSRQRLRHSQITSHREHIMRKGSVPSPRSGGLPELNERSKRLEKRG